MTLREPMRAQPAGRPGAAAPGETAVAVGYLGLLVILWGGNYTWVRIAMADIGPLWFNLGRYGLAVLVLAVALGALGRGLVPVRGERVALAVIGLLQAGFMTTMTALAMRWIEASKVVLIAYTVPVWALLFGAAILGERISRGAAAGMAMALAGLAILTDPFAMDWAAQALWPSAIALAGVLGWALGAVLYRRRRWRSGFWAQVFWQLLATALAMAALAPLLEDPAEIRVTGPMLAVTLYNALFPILLGFFCWVQALSRLSAHAAGQIMVLAPLYGVVQSNLVLGEPLGPGLLVAGALIVGGAWLTLSRPAETGSPR